MKFRSEPFAVCAVIVREAGDVHQVLLLRRNGSLAGKGCQIAGAIEAGETAWQAALREVEVETGLRRSCSNGALFRATEGA
ncbi:8-oxo-dGTP pyrophosphatase MutT (NUDIX family) [Ensifer adhaerens]|uniref:8-oxo-dGTP pyrophosphatase MutT (NUDIX family) n=1 Tax=Ensifer adhaerens TaxID=106592 RepID=A0ACC5SNY2_ENSAD|nr:NUDIX domain-containing protein [Ensifer adhaerens]MBP1870485.1 8-oxo-dGTP pyrophosphatase MutT (NUDIX family) [Ensifer adhaerens]